MYYLLSTIILYIIVIPLSRGILKKNELLFAFYLFDKITAFFETIFFIATFFFGFIDIVYYTSYNIYYINCVGCKL